MPPEKSLYTRLGGYDAIAAVADHLVSRLTKDEQLGRFWAHRGSDGLAREKQLLIDFLCASAGGPLLYTGRNMTTTHRGMRIDEGDWTRFLGHLRATLDHFNVGKQEWEEVVGFVDGMKGEIAEQVNDQ
jgi:hemoglobin